MQQRVMISGASFVGAVLAVDLSQRGIPTILVDLKDVLNESHHDIDGRSIAVSYASAKYLEKLGVWGYISQPLQGIKEIRVLEKDSPWTIYYEPQLLKEPHIQEVGYMVNATDLKKAIYLCLKESVGPTLTFIKEITVQKATCTESKVNITFNHGEQDTVSLLVSAEGRTSKIRNDQGFSLLKTRYDQMALVFNITHDKDHEGIAWELFTPDGPFASLPLLDHPDGRHKSGIVWSCQTEKAQYLQTLSDAALADKIESVFHFNGKVQLDSQRWVYPLSAQVTRHFCQDRIALVGDAAHTLHPVAGQGVNLGWRDAKDLATLLGEAHSLGLDLGSKCLLSKYNKSRVRDSWAGFFVTDTVVRLFSNESKFLGFLRNAAFAVINQTPPLKRQLMKKAMGLL